MKKRTIISMILAMTMIAGCAKSEKTEETTVEETTTEATTENTTETTAAATPTPTPRPTATPTPEPTAVPTPTAPHADEYDPSVDYYGEVMALVASLEEEAPGENRYFTKGGRYGYLSLNVIHPDGTTCEYVRSGGEFVVRSEGSLSVTTFDDYPLDGETFMQIPCLYDMDYACADPFVAGVPEDGVYTGYFHALTGDMDRGVITCGHFVKFDEDHALSLSEGDVVELPEMEPATVVEVDDLGQIHLDNDLLIKTGCSNTGDPDGWYLAYYANDIAYTISNGAYELPIASDCVINESSQIDTDDAILAEYQAAIEASDTPLAASYMGQHIEFDDDYSNNGYYISWLTLGTITSYEVRDGEIVRIDIRYTYGL